jgi:hypothetical protein
MLPQPADESDPALSRSASFCCCFYQVWIHPTQSQLRFQRPNLSCSARDRTRQRLRLSCCTSWQRFASKRLPLEEHLGSQARHSSARKSPERRYPAGDTRSCLAASRNLGCCKNVNCRKMVHELLPRVDACSQNTLTEETPRHPCSPASQRQEETTAARHYPRRDYSPAQEQDNKTSELSCAIYASLSR